MRIKINDGTLLTTEKIFDHIWNLGDSSITHLLSYKDGFVIISACVQGDLPVNKPFKEFTLKEKENYEECMSRTKSLKEDLRSLGFGYIPTLGGYHEERDNTFTDVTELSVIVPYYDKSKSEDPKQQVHNKEEFINKMLELGKKYDQNSILVKIPDFNDGLPSYVNCNTQVVESNFKSVGEKKGNEMYFTSLQKKSKSAIKENRGFVFGDSIIPTVDDKYIKSYYKGSMIPDGLAHAYEIHDGWNLEFKSIDDFEKYIKKYDKGAK